MSALVKELKVRISADTNGLKGALNGISGDISRVSKDFEGLKKVGDGISSVGKKLTAGLTLPIAGIAVASTKTAGDFESAMNQVSAISGATGKDLDSLTQLAKDMGATTKFSASESAEALSYMGMAGWKTEDMLSGLPGILNLASAGGTDLATTSDIVTDGLTSMGLTAKDTDKFVDIMASTCSNANTNIELMGETLKYVGPVAGSLGVEMDDLSVAIGLMGNAGLKGSNAGTALRAGLANLVNPTKEMAKAMKKYGVELITNKDGSVDLMGTMQNLRTVLGDLDQTTQAQALSTIFGKEAMSGWASIVNASEGDFNKLSEAIANSDGVAQSMSDTMMQGMNGALTQMKSALEGVAITIGERLTPFIEKLADGISKVCDWFNNLSPTTQTIIMVIVGLVACIGPLLILVGSGISLFANLSIVAGGLSTTVGALMGAFSSVIGVVVAVVGAIAGFIAIIVNAYKENETFRSTVDSVFNNIKSIISNVMSVIKDVISMAWSVIKVIWDNGLKQILQTALTALATMANNFTSRLNTITSIVKTAISLIKAVFSGDFKSVGNIVNNILQNIVNAFNNKMEQARSKVDSAIQKIKSIMNFSWSLPKLKLPHISITGKFSLSPPSVPKFGISWYSKGAIFKRPTVLGGMGIGDRHNGIGSNAEAILPINQLPKLLGLDKQNNNGNLSLNIENFNNNREQDVKELVEEIAFYLKRKNIAIGGV
nr:MAG TPA: minor tail protein [Caudoviricetes sp.]